VTAIELRLDLWPRQLRALTTPARELIFGGASEGGKSHFVRVALTTWCLGIPNLQCVLIRKRYKDIWANHVEGPTGFKRLLEPLVSGGQVSITKDGVAFWNGSNIQFQHCQDERQFDSAQGVEKHVLVIDEATQIPERLIRFFRAWVRMPAEMKEALPEWARGKFPRIIYTANPIGVSVPFFRRNFVDLLPNEEIRLVDGFERQYIPSLYTDNPSVDPVEHAGRLSGIGDAAIAAALDTGDWSQLIGEFFPEYEDSIHAVDDFIPPQHWYRFRTFDWGSAEPFCVHWWAVSDGEPFRDSQRRERWYPRGALVCYFEWYGCDPEEPAKGIRMRNEEIASGIIARSEPNHRDLITLTDSLPFQDRGGEGIDITFLKNGVPLTRGDTSRVVGWSQVRSRLIGIKTTEGERAPMIYFCKRCKAARDYIPAIPRHPSESKKEDAAEHGETTHAPDSVRLACMAHTDSVIRERLIPMQSRVDRAIKEARPTVNKLLKRAGYAQLNN